MRTTGMFEHFNHSFACSDLIADTIQNAKREKKLTYSKRRWWWCSIWVYNVSYLIAHKLLMLGDTKAGRRKFWFSHARRSV